MRRTVIGVLLAGLGAFCIGALATSAGATAFRAPREPSIDAPSGDPVVVSASSSGAPEAVTVKVSGFEPNTNVFVEQCSGEPETADGWTPTRSCDAGTSPAAAIVDADGNATFDASDPNHTFTPVSGLSPQGLFNCVPEGVKAPDDEVETFSNCRIRVSTNNLRPTSDQVFLAIKLPGSGESSDSGSNVSTYLLVFVVGAVVVIGVAFARRRTRADKQVNRR